MIIPVTLQAQNADPKEVRELAKGGSSTIPKLTEYSKHADVEVRREAVKAIAELGTQRSLDPLVAATRDNDPEVQIRATDGLVNFYLPGYLQTGFGATLKRAGTSVKGRFTDTNDQAIEPYIQVRPEVIESLGKLARGGGSMDVRANAARALGILRGRAAIPDLLDACRSKDGEVLYEALVAFQKINDPSVAPKLRYLLRDLDERVQLAAIETTGLLQNKEALPDLVEVLGRARNQKIARRALTAIAMIPDQSSRALYAKYLVDKDDGMRAAAAEGFARLKSPADVEIVRKAYEAERKPAPRISMAFALVAQGNTEISEFSPLQLLVNTLNSKARQGEAFAFLAELARDPAIRASLYRAMSAGTKDEKIYLSRVMARSGDKEAEPHLEQLSRDGDSVVAQEALRALQNLKARL